MDQAWLIATLLQNLLNTVLFAKIFFAHKLDLEPIRKSQRFRVLSNAFTQSIRKFGIIEDPYPVPIQIRGHALCVTEWIQTTGDHDPIIAAQYSIQFIAVLFRKQFVHGSTPVFASGLNYLTTLPLCGVLKYARGKVAVGNSLAHIPFLSALLSHTLCDFPFLVSACPS
jgi:hypothetical protein